MRFISPSHVCCLVKNKIQSATACLRISLSRAQNPEYSKAEYSKMTRGKSHKTPAKKRELPNFSLEAPASFVFAGCLCLIELRPICLLSFVCCDWMELFFLGRSGQSYRGRLSIGNRLRDLIEIAGSHELLVAHGGVAV